MAPRPPSKKQPRGKGVQARGGRGTHTGPAHQPSSSLPSSQAASQGLAPATPGFQAPTPGFQAPTAASEARRGVPARSTDVEMLDPSSHTEPLTEVNDQDMQDAPVASSAEPVAAPSAPVAAPSTTPVAASSAPVAAPAEQTIQVASLLDNLPPAPPPAPPLSRGEQTRLRLANLRARAAAEVAAVKRPRNDSADDNAEVGPSAAKKQHTEVGSSAAEKQHTEKSTDHQGVTQPSIVRKPFPYRETTRIRRGFCCLRVEGSPIFGSLQRQNGWGMKFAMDAGMQGVHGFGIELMCNVVDMSVPLKDIDSAPGDLDVISMAWFAGAPADDARGTQGPYQLEDFEIFCVQDYPEHKVANDTSVLAACTEGMKKKLTYCRFKSNKTYLTDESLGGPAWENVDHAFLPYMRALTQGSGYTIELWFLHPFGDSPLFEAKLLSHFRRAYEERLPILSQYDILDLVGTPSIMAVGDGMYCRYPMKSVPGSKKKVADPSQGPIGFSQLPTPTVYNFRREFEIYHALIPIREAQYQQGLAINIEMNTVRVYLMSLTGIEVKDRAQFQQMTRVQQRLHKTFYAFIRMPGPKGQKELAPNPGLRVQIEWDNSDRMRQKAHAPVKSSERWKGLVIPHQGATVTATGTDYCVLLTMPDSVNSVPFRPFMGPKYLPNQQLPLAHLKVKYSNVTYERELEAWQSFCNSGKAQIMPMQQVLMSKKYLDNVQVTWFNVAGGPDGTEENKQRYKELVDRFERDGSLDQSQVGALKKAGSAPFGTRILQGPPGTGKTRTAVHLTWALVNAGHKVLFVAPTNVAVDNATTALLQSRPADMAHHKVLRVETTNISMGEITKYVDYDDMERLDQPAIEKPLPVPQDDPVFADFLEEFEALVDVQADVDYAKFQAETNSFEKAYELALNAYKTRAQDYPVEASMDFNVWKTCKEDHDLGARRQRNAQLRTPHNVTELITSEETESSEYSKAVQSYIHFQDKPGSAGAKAFMKLRVQQEARNISKASVICTTSSNAAADILRAKFEPTVIIVDEVGQLTAPALAVPLMAFKKWLATYLIGDPKQLTPLITCLRLCEVRGIVERSVLGTYIERQYLLLFLEIQYRMDPEIALFPNQIFYDGKLRNAASTEIDNVYKQAIRRVTSKYYGIKGKDGNGSLYMMVDVVHGRGRLEEGGTSLQNYANADAIVEAIKYLLDEGFPRSEIKLLTLYKGQKTVLVSKLVQGIEGDHWLPEDVTTVDSYQGKQGVFACLDMVAANPIQEGKFPNAFADEDTAAVDQGRFLNVEGASSYVTNPHRLCVGITRTTCGLFAFCQTATLVRAYKPSKSAYQNAAFKMVEDAQQRELIYRDTKHFDTHPTALSEVTNLDAYNTRMQQRMQDQHQFNFVEKVMRMAQIKKHEREERRSALLKIPEPKLSAPGPSRRVPNVLPKRLTTAAVEPEPIPTISDQAEGSVPVNTRPPTQREQKKAKKNTRDKAVAALVAEEEKTGKKKPEVIPRPVTFEGSWAEEAQDAAEEQEGPPDQEEDSDAGVEYVESME